MQLGNLFKGFFRQLPRQRGARRAAVGNLAKEDPPMSVKEGKDAMSVELYTKLCGWFLNWATLDGVFCYSFLVFSWNLACRSNNTGEVYLTDTNWVTYFYTFDIFFAHTKTDQTSNDAKYPRHLFANPTNPLICPVFALSLYFFAVITHPLTLGCFSIPTVISTQDSEMPLLLVLEKIQMK